MKNRSVELEVAALSGLLDGLVRLRRTATYAFVAEHLGHRPGSARLWGLLQTVALEDAADGLPHSCLLVVEAETGRPSEAMWRLLRHAGLEVAEGRGDEDAAFMAQMSAMGVNPSFPMRPEY